MKKKIYKLKDLKRIEPSIAPSLDLIDIEAEECLKPKDNGKYLVFRAKVKRDVRTKECPFCKAKNSLIFSGKTKKRKIHDLMRNNCRVDIVVTPVRVECKNCHQRFVAELNEIDDTHAMTKRLFEYIKTEGFVSSHTAIAVRSGVSIETIRKIVEEEIDKLDANRLKNPLPAPRVLGIDEKHIVNLMRGTLVNVETGELLDMLEDNRHPTMENAIMRLTDWDTNIKVVTTDMNNSYISWLKGFLPNATIVIDKFHVIQNLEHRISAVKKELYAYRKELIAQCEDAGEKARQLGILNILRDKPRLINYSMNTIIEEEGLELSLALATVIEAFPEFRLLRTLYYMIEYMYEQETLEAAEAVWDEWLEMLPPADNKRYSIWCKQNNVPESSFNEFRSFSRQGFLFYEPYILNYFREHCRETNAATEGVNNMIGTVNSIGNGYSFKILRGKSLYSSLVNPKIQYDLDIEGF